MYDRLGRLIETHFAGVDPFGPSVGTTRPDGTPGGAPINLASSGIAYTYEIDGELTQMTHQFSGQSVTFSYDVNDTMSGDGTRVFNCDTLASRASSP